MLRADCRRLFRKRGRFRKIEGREFTYQEGLGNNNSETWAKNYRESVLNANKAKVYSSNSITGSIYG